MVRSGYIIGKGDAIDLATDLFANTLRGRKDTYYISRSVDGGKWQRLSGYKTIKGGLALEVL